MGAALPKGHFETNTHLGLIYTPVCISGLEDGGQLCFQSQLFSELKQHVTIYPYNIHCMSHILSLERLKPGTRETAQPLGTPAALAGDMSSALSSHTGWLTSICNSSSRIHSSLLVCVGTVHILCPYRQVITHTHTHTCAAFRTEPARRALSSVRCVPLLGRGGQSSGLTFHSSQPLTSSRRKSILGRGHFIYL